ASRVKGSTTLRLNSLTARTGHHMTPLFPPSFSSPGKGNIHLTLLPPAIPSFSTLSYTYPLKLLPSTPYVLSSPPEKESQEPQLRLGQNVVADLDASSSSFPNVLTRPVSVPLVFVVTYGGGLLAGDCIDLNIRLDPYTRLTIATQGSTKVFKTPTLPSNQEPETHPISETRVISNANNPSGARIGQTTAPDFTSRQDLRIRIGTGAGIWLGPDPIQPFANSQYAQTQIFEVEKGASMGAVDWVTEGRRARNESWAMDGWRGRNEIWGIIPVKAQKTGKEPTMERRALMVRDSVILHPDGVKGGIKALLAGAGVFGTLLLYGSIFAPLSEFFLSEFSSLPRIGGRNWNPDGQPTEEDFSARQRWRTQRVEKEKADGVLWTAARVRGGVTIVKFSAAQVEGGRAWLGCMLREEASVSREFGDGALMFVR
ncbi:hypothetical protein MMC29_007217, partial [Sticta canariensis]|nr:hypothetical protein [Sticta canariensis]